MTEIYLQDCTGKRAQQEKQQPGVTSPLLRARVSHVVLRVLAAAVFAVKLELLFKARHVALAIVDPTRRAARSVHAAAARVGAGEVDFVGVFPWALV